VSWQTLVVTEAGDRVEIRLNRPEARNASNAVMIADQLGVCTALERRPRFLIITVGSEGLFAAGRRAPELLAPARGRGAGGPDDRVARSIGTPRAVVPDRTKHCVANEPICARSGRAGNRDAHCARCRRGGRCRRRAPPSRERPGLRSRRGTRRSALPLVVGVDGAAPLDERAREPRTAQSVLAHAEADLDHRPGAIRRLPSEHEHPGAVTGLERERPRLHFGAEERTPIPTLASSVIHIIR
jgi:hypothetical protein